MARLYVVIFASWQIIMAYARTADLAREVSDVPKFTQINCVGRDRKHDVCIKVDYPKDRADDVLLMMRTPDEPTILVGHLKKEKGVKATVILNDEYNKDAITIVFHSQHVSTCSLFSVDVSTNQTECITGWSLGSRSNDVMTGKSLQEESLPERTLSPRKVNPDGYILNVALCYDDLWDAQFQSGALKRAKAVMAIVVALYSEKTLAIKIDINMLAYEHCSGSSWNGLDYGVHLEDDFPAIIRDSLPTANLYVFVTAGEHDEGLLGQAYDIGSVCGPKIGRSTLSRYSPGSIKNGDAYTAETIAHEMGHNLGMYHDFKDHLGPGNYREVNGKPCKGYMDYNDNTNKWSKCSGADFKRYLNGLSKICLGARCVNKWSKWKCQKGNKGGKKCGKKIYKKNCRLTCKKCCGDIAGPEWCIRRQIQCNKGSVKNRCQKTCGQCS